MSTTQELDQATCSDIDDAEEQTKHLSYALSQIEKVKKILTTALCSTENYEIIQKDLSEEKDEISKLPNVDGIMISMEIPKIHKNYLKKVFKISNKKNTKLVGKELNNYLKTFLIDVRNTDIILQKSVTEYSYCDLLKFLKDHKDSYKLFENNILHDSCLYGCILNKFYEVYQMKIKNDEKSESYSDILKKEFEISDRYARKLRWLGKLWSDHKKIGNLCIAFSKLYQHKKQLDIFFKSELAKEWM